MVLIHLDKKTLVEYVTDGDETVEIVLGITGKNLYGTQILDESSLKPSIFVYINRGLGNETFMHYIGYGFPRELLYIGSELAQLKINRANQDTVFKAVDRLVSGIEIIRSHEDEDFMYAV